MINHAVVDRRYRPVLLIRRLAIVALGIGCSPAAPRRAPPAPSSPPSAPTRGVAASADPAQAAAIDKVVQDEIKARHLRAVIVRVTVDGKEIITKAYGESMTGVPATVDMHFRNGAVAISYVSNLLLLLVDEKKVSLDDKVSKWVPEIPHSDEVTLGQLAQMTSGYTDYVIGNAEVDAMLYADPFRQWTPEELIATVTSKPLLYPPGHELELRPHQLPDPRAGAREDHREEDVGPDAGEGARPAGADEHHRSRPGTPAIPEPALHAFTSERRSQLGIPAGTRFYEESTYWNPSWTITQGAIQTTNIFDVNTTAVAIGTGKLLSPESYQKMISTDLRGKTTALPGCATCFAQSEGYSYGLGIVTTGNWLMQDPLFSGEAGAFAYLPVEEGRHRRRAHVDRGRVRSRTAATSPRSAATRPTRLAADRHRRRARRTRRRRGSRSSIRLAVEDSSRGAGDDRAEAGEQGSFGTRSAVSRPFDSCIVSVSWV